MFRESKGAATIRRKVKQHSVEDLQKVKNNFLDSRVLSSEEAICGSANEECYLFHEAVLGPSIAKKIISSEKTLFLGLVVFRTINALLIQTQFVPDEYWQSLEVAHYMVFGYGYRTWEWLHGLRGYLYPAVFATLYKILAIFNLDYRLLLIMLPRILQGLLAAAGDLYLYKLSKKLSGRGTAQWTLICQLASWFTLYCCTRTLTNSTEASLMTIALFYYPWPDKPDSTKASPMKFLSLASLSVLIRPTAALTWVLMCGWHLQQQTQKLLKLMKYYIFVGLTACAISISIDQFFYGKPVFVQYNFFKFNVLFDMGAFYGSHPWYWYLVQGYPAIMFVHLVPFSLGAWKAENKVLLVVIMWTIFIYSFLSHKEFRFLLPILPLSMHYCGAYFQSLCCKPSKSERRKNISPSVYISSSDSDSSKSREAGSKCSQNKSLEAGKNDKKMIREKHRSQLFRARICILIIILTNIPVALYFSLIHQRGTIQVMSYLHNEATTKSVRILFLMPCHSTPYHSYLHKNVSLRFLTCEPNLYNKKNYTEEAEIFYRDPLKWTKAEYGNPRAMWPTHVVYFNSLGSGLPRFLSRSGFRECARFFHAHFADGRVGNYVIVSCR